MRAAAHWQNYVESTVDSNTHNVLNTELEHINWKKFMLKTWRPVHLQPKHHDSTFNISTIWRSVSALVYFPIKGRTQWQVGNCKVNATGKPAINYGPRDKLGIYSWVIHQMRNTRFKCQSNIQTHAKYSIKKLKEKLSPRSSKQHFHWYWYCATTWPKWNLNARKSRTLWKPA